MFGPHFLASLVFQKYGLHQPLNSQRDRLESEGISLSLPTLADQIGAVSVAARPLFLLIEAHVLAAERLHGDDTTVPRLAKYKTDVARIWDYVRDDRPFGGPAPPAVLCYYSRITPARPAYKLASPDKFLASIRPLFGKIMTAQVGGIQTKLAAFAAATSPLAYIVYRLARLFHERAGLAGNGLPINLPRKRQQKRIASTSARRINNGLDKANMMPGYAMFSNPRS